MAMDYAKYVKNNPDLLAAAAAAGMSARDFGKVHWDGGGKNEGRAITPVQSAEEKKDNIEYVRNNPDLRENAEAAGLTADETAEMAAWHYDTYGKNEGRMNTPGVVNLPSAADQVLGPEHFQDRDFRSVLEASVRAGDPSEMWEARADIGEAAGTPWGLDQFTAQGWNLAADRPYGRGLLGDTIGVETEIGQLTDTANKRFLQDRYEDAAIANDFPANWVGADGEWKGPSELAGYWSQMTNAIRDSVTGEISSVTDRPDTGWAGSDVLPVGDRWSGNLRPVDTTLADQGGLGSVYRPWTQSYWDKYLGPDVKKSLFSMKAPPVEQGLAYLPGEFRDPKGWSQFTENFQGHVPEGSWRTAPGHYNIDPGRTGPLGRTRPPWQFTSPATATNIAYTPGFTGADISPAAAAEWSGLLGGLTAPALNTTNLLGGTT